MIIALRTVYNLSSVMIAFNILGVIPESPGALFLRLCMAFVILSSVGIESDHCWVGS